MRPSRLAILLLAMITGSPGMPAHAQAQSDEETASDLLHSDLPLFGDDTEDKWPQHFSENDSFGCMSRVALGDWTLREAGEKEEDAEWYRIQNYGVFHCWAMVGTAYKREKLSGAELEPAFFVFLGTAEKEGGKLELWAAQIGARPGSEYLLLARSSTEGVIKAFDVLQTECPRAYRRDAGSLDILLTRYCSMNTRAGLLRLARQMVQRPPRGELSIVAPLADDEK